MDGRWRIPTEKRMEMGAWYWREYYEDLYNIDTQEQVAVHMCGFDGVRRATTSEESRLGEWRLR